MAYGDNQQQKTAPTAAARPENPWWEQQSDLYAQAVASGYGAADAAFGGVGVARQNEASLENLRNAGRQELVRQGAQAFGQAASAFAPRGGARSAMLRQTAMDRGRAANAWEADMQQRMAQAQMATQQQLGEAYSQQAAAQQFALEIGSPQERLQEKIKQTEAQIQSLVGGSTPGMEDLFDGVDYDVEAVSNALIEMYQQATTPEERDYIWRRYKALVTDVAGIAGPGTANSQVGLAGMAGV